MKFNIATLALFLASADAVAVPEQGPAPEMSDLMVTPDFFPGVTFSGTAESVYNEMKALNPASVGNLTSDPLEQDTSSSLVKRSTFNCGWGKVVLWNSCIEGKRYLEGLGSAWCSVRGGYGQQARVSCSNKCGMYLTNKMSYDFRVSCGDIAKDIWETAYACRYTDNLINTRGARDFDTHYIGLGGDNC